MQWIGSNPLGIASNLDINVILVTYNRKDSLIRCLLSLIKQSLPPSRIYIIDNASIDGTYETLEKEGLLKADFIIYHRLNVNTGGAGGFSAGLALALSEEGDWFWMMDDDANPNSDALSELMKIATNSGNIYGSTPVHKELLSWGVTTISSQGEKKYLEKADEMPPVAEVAFLPFLGILVHRQLVNIIGLPDAGFFIAADDVEYTVRAKKYGAKIIQAGKSLIEHPPASKYRIRIMGYTIYCLKLPPWKRYYDTRNRLLLARKHYGKRLYSETIPGLLVRMIATLVYEPHKRMQIFSFIAGFIDGLLGYKGSRHTVWRIPTK